MDRRHPNERIKPLPNACLPEAASGQRHYDRLVDAPPLARLLAFARELQRAETFVDLLAVTQRELAEALGYQHAWLMVADDDEATQFRLLDAAGAIRDAAWEHAPLLQVRGDAMIEEIVASDAPVVVADARTDPRTNKAIVAQLGNRTIINVPLRMLDKPLGAFGTGTFGDEGCREPSPAQLDYLVGMGSQLSVAAGRIRFREERRRAEAAVHAVEEQLRHAQKMEAVGRLAGGIAHDFNNMLSVIMSYAGLLLLDLDPKSQVKEDVEQIEKAAQRAAELTRKLLAFSRQQPLAPRALDLGEIIAGFEPMLRRLIGEDIELETLIPRQLARLVGDPGLIEQVVMNLVVNARDAMPDGGKLLLEAAEVVLDDAYAREHVGARMGRHVMLAISDTGHGMDAATQKRMFEPFFTTKEPGKGTGLGLSTVYGLVKQSGGNIRVYSEPGKGTVVRIYLPADEAGVEAERPVHAPATLHGDEVVLIVEDDEQLRRVACEVLERFGYTVCSAGDADEALRFAEDSAQRIDLLMSDVVLPRMSGRELVQHFTRLRSHTPVLLMSGYTEAAAVRHHGIGEEIPLLPKPITPDSLLAKVREVLDHDRARRPGVANG
ncbi:MAG TPA: ATP-binding protein [Nannocystaceae bacterium]|nr:ATP-binding protein [Nannocystaceae bacterium]